MNVWRRRRGDASLWEIEIVESSSEESPVVQGSSEDGSLGAFETGL
jgi:hypothetical protein